VISPQNGHILCDPKSLRYVCIAKSFLSGPAMKANNLRTRIRKGCMRFTAEMPAFPGRSIGGRQVTRKRTWNNYPSCPRRPRIATLSQRRQAHNDTSAAAIVCKIAQFTQEAILGGKHGRVVASCRTTEGWSAPAFVSVGAEAGECRLESKA